MTPTEEITAAAEKLRTLAAAASEAPWTVDSWDNVQTAGLETVAEVWPLNAEPGVNVGYIAAMHPGVGMTIGRWLESWKGVDLDEAASWSQDAEHALAVARSINGSQP